MQLAKQPEKYSHSVERVPNRVFERAIRNVPEPVRATFTSAQLLALEHALRPQNSKHRVDYRVSLPWFGQRAYVTLLAGKENRSIGRLRDEGQIDVGRVVTIYGLAISLVVGLMFMTGLVFLYSLNKILEPDSGRGTTYSYSRR